LKHRRDNLRTSTLVVHQMVGNPLRNRFSIHPVYGRVRLHRTGQKLDRKWMLLQNSYSANFEATVHKM